MIGSQNLTLVYFLESKKPHWFLYFYQKLFKFNQVIDFGGGDGLFCRIMRDYKFDCNTYDKYSKNTYSKGFDNINIKNVDLLTSFEVIEHFEDPAEEFIKIFDF